MTNIYDVISKVQVKAHANLKAEIVDELEVEDPPIEEAAAILKGDVKTKEVNESSEGDEEERSPEDNQQNL